MFQEPEDETIAGAALTVPKPKVKLNLVVIRTADEPVGPKPIVVGPAQQKTLVLVLSKKGESGDQQQIIEVPAPPGQEPEVFFIDYKEGENSLLPGGIYLQDALKYAARDGGSGEGIGSGGYSASAGLGGGSGAGGSSGGYDAGLVGLAGGSQGASGVSSAGYQPTSGGGNMIY